VAEAIEILGLAGTVELLLFVWEKPCADVAEERRVDKGRAGETHPNA